MDKYPILPEGGKLVLDDLLPAFKVGGVAGDILRGQLGKTFVETTNRLGYVVPERSGPIVLPDGATGKVKVQPFTAYRSAAGATSSAGTDGASGGSENPTQNTLSAYYAGAEVTVPTPLPTAGNHNWYLLYAIVAEADSDAASRPVESTAGVVSAATVNTRHSSSVTLAWVQGTQAAQATDPFPGANFPALPAPAANQAHVPLAYMHVFDDATPGTVTYDKNRIRNDPRYVRPNIAAGGHIVALAKQAIYTDAGATQVNGLDTKSLVTAVPSASGGWPVVVTGKRPSRAGDPIQGGGSLWIELGPFKVSATPFSSSWTFFTAAIASPDPADVAAINLPIDWRDRYFEGTLYATRTGGGTESWAHDAGAAIANVSFPTALGATGPNYRVGPQIGNSIRDNQTFNTAAGMSGVRLACYFPDITGASANNDIALVVDGTSGKLYIGVREATSGVIAGRIILMKVDFTDRLQPFGFGAGA